MSIQLANKQPLSEKSISGPSMAAGENAGELRLAFINPDGDIISKSRSATGTWGASIKVTRVNPAKVKGVNISLGRSWKDKAPLTFITYSNSVKLFIWRSKDAGQTWEPLSADPNIPFYQHDGVDDEHYEPWRALRLGFEDSSNTSFDQLQGPRASSSVPSLVWIEEWKPPFPSAKGRLYAEQGTPKDMLGYIRWNELWQDRALENWAAFWHDDKTGTQRNVLLLGSSQIHGVTIKADRGIPRQQDRGYKAGFEPVQYSFLWATNEQSKRRGLYDFATDDENNLRFRWKLMLDAGSKDFSTIPWGVAYNKFIPADQPWPKMGAVYKTTTQPSAVYLNRQTQFMFAAEDGEVYLGSPVSIQDPNWKDPVKLGIKSKYAPAAALGMQGEGAVLVWREEDGSLSMTNMK